MRIPANFARRFGYGHPNGLMGITKFRRAFGFRATAFYRSYGIPVRCPDRFFGRRRRRRRRSARKTRAPDVRPRRREHRQFRTVVRQPGLLLVTTIDDRAFCRARNYTTIRVLIQ